MDNKTSADNLTPTNSIPINPSQTGLGSPITASPNPPDSQITQPTNGINIADNTPAPNPASFIPVTQTDPTNPTPEPVVQSVTAQAPADSTTTQTPAPNWSMNDNIGTNGLSMSGNGMQNDIQPPTNGYPTTPSYSDTPAAGSYQDNSYTEMQNNPSQPAAAPYSSSSSGFASPGLSDPTAFSTPQGSTEGVANPGFSNGLSNNSSMDSAYSSFQPNGLNTSPASNVPSDPTSAFGSSLGNPYPASPAPNPVVSPAYPAMNQSPYSSPTNSSPSDNFSSGYGTGFASSTNQVSEPAPTDLSHLIDNSTIPQPATQAQPVPAPISQPDTLVIPPGGNMTPVIPGVTTGKNNDSGVPKWIIGVGAGLLLLVVGASAYFIFGVGQTKDNNTSLPATTQLSTPVPLVPTATLAPVITASPSATPIATSSALPTSKTSTSSARLASPSATPRTSR